MRDKQGNYILCSTGKVCYTKKEAGWVINNASKNHPKAVKRRGKNIPKRKYFCKVCGCYHTTHQTFFYTSKSKEALEQKFYSSFA